MAIRGLPQTIPELVSEAGTLLRQGRLAEAANLYQHILDREPGNLNALHLYGVLSLQAGNAPQAIEHIERAIEVDASRAPIHFNLGNACLQAGQTGKAISAYRRALGIDNGMAAAWCGLGTALARAGEYNDAIAAAGQALHLEPDSIAALGCMAAARQKAGETAEALTSYTRALEIAPDNPELLNGAGFAHYELGQYEEAAQLCRQATRLAPEYGLAYFNLGLALTESGRLAAATKALTRATQLLANPALCHNALGRALLLSGRHLDALQAFSRATELEPELASAHNNLGLALQRLGDPDDAKLAYEQALAVNPGYADAWLNLGLLSEQSHRFEEAEASIRRGLEALPQDPALTLLAARLRRRAEDPDAALALLEQLPPQDLSAELRQRVLFERGRLANSLEQEDEAFRCFSQANELSRQSPAGVYFRQQNYAQDVQALSRSMAGNWADSWESAVFDGSDDPVFLVGFPFSGTALLERILAGHPDVVAMQEQPLITRTGQKLLSGDGEYPALLGGLPLGQRQALREEYLAQARAEVGWQPGQLLVDKFPLNTIHLPLIHCLFPNARLLVAQRHPCAVALSCFMHDFELNEAMVNFTSLRDTAELYDAVMSIGHSARQQLPLQVHPVSYEKLVDNLEGEARALLQFLGLEWHSQLLDFVTSNARETHIQPASYEPVNLPLKREAQLHWQRYRTFLEPIEPLLQTHCERLGYSI